MRKLPLVVNLFIISLLIVACKYSTQPPGANFGNNFKYNNSTGYITPEDVKAGLTLKKKYKEGTTQVTEVSKHVYSFGYFPALASKGRPVKSFQNVYEKHRMVADNTPFYFGELMNDMTTFDAFMVKTNDDKDQKYYNPLYIIADYTSDGIFYSDAKQVYWQYNNTTMGTPIHLRYRKEIKDVKYLASIFFHQNSPQKEKVISIEVPSWMEIEIIERNFEGYEITKSAKKITMDELVKLENGNLPPTKKEEKEKSNQKQDKPKIITYTLKNLEGVKKEPSAVGISYNLPHIVVLCKKLDEKKAKAFAQKEKAEKSKETKKANKNDPLEQKRKRQQGNYKTALISNIDDLYKWYHEIVLLTKNDSALTGAKARELTATCKTPYEKMETIFYWVQDNIRYVAFEDGLAAFKPDACQDVYNNRYGDCKGMANLLTNMLNSVGLNAHITWIGTRHLNYDYTIPSVIVDNHMICTVYLNGKKYFLDATEDFIGVNDYAHRIQGRPVLISKGDEYAIDTVPNLSPDRNLVTRKANFKIIDNTLKGRVEEVLRGEPKTQLIWAINNMPGQQKDKALNRYLDESYHYILPDSIQHSDVMDRKSDFSLNYLLTLKQHVLRKGNSLFVNPDYSFEMEGRRLDSTRFFDLDFSHKINSSVDYLIEIPAGYKLKYMPPKIQIDNPEFSLLVEYTQEGNFVRYKKQIQVKQGVVTKKNFVAWNNMLNQLNKSYTDWLQFQL